MITVMVNDIVRNNLFIRNLRPEQLSTKPSSLDDRPIEVDIKDLVLASPRFLCPYPADVSVIGG
jgi:hypothetical protein